MQRSIYALVCSHRLTLYLLLSSLLNLPIAAAPVTRIDGRFLATAYAQSGITASGVHTQNHVVAADPDILPVGSIIKIRHAGRYSGEYVVADTGEKVLGRHLDIYVPSVRECKKFGKRHVRIKVVSLGAGTHEDTKQAVEVVKHDVQKDVSKGVVGNAANEADWRKQGGPVAAAVGATPTQSATPKSPASSEGPP